MISNVCNIQGRLTVREGAHLDAEQENRYTFMVDARDNPKGGGYQRATSAQVRRQL